MNISNYARYDNWLIDAFSVKGLEATFLLLLISCIETVSMSKLRSCTAYLPSDVHVPAAVEGGGVASEHDAGHAHPEVAQTTRTWRCRKIIVNAEK